MEIDEPCAWTLAVLYIKRPSNCMRMVESGTTLDNMAWCRRHIFVVNSDDKEGCTGLCVPSIVRLERVIIWVWEHLSSIHLIRPFLTAIQKLCLTTKHRALGFQKDSWSCGQSLHITNLVVDHRSSFSDVPLTPRGPGFVDYVLSIINADRAVWLIWRVLLSFLALLSPPPPAPKLKVHFQASRRVFMPTPPHLKARRPPPSKAWKARG